MNSFHLQDFIPFGQAIGWTILHSIWQILLISLGIRLILLFVSPHKPKIRYGLLLIGLVLMTLWIGCTFSQEWTRQQLAEIATNDAPLSLEKPDQTITVFSTEAVAEEPPRVSSVSPVVHSIPLEIQTLGMKLVPYLPMIALLWFIGALLFSISMIFGFWQLHLLRKNEVQSPDPQWQTRFEQLAQQMGIRRPLQFLLSQAIPEPITFHFFKPVVLAPLSIFSGLTSEQIEILLLHELAHIRRQDFLVNILQTIVEVLFFYHPAVWWLSARIREEREHCCDDMVLKVRNNPLLYAEALTQLHHLFNHPLKTKLVMSAKGNQSNFSKRIFRLFGRYDTKPSVFKGSLIALLLLLGMLTQAFLRPSPILEQPELNIHELVEEPSLELNNDSTLHGAVTPAENATSLPAKEVAYPTDQPPTQLLSGNSCRDLLQAIRKNDIETVRQLLKTTDPNCTYYADRDTAPRDEWEPRSPLVLAARRGYLEIGKLLLEANADVNFHGNGDETPLMAAAQYGHLDFVKFLINNNAPVNTKVSGDGTALLVASREGHEDVVRYLLEQKAEVNAQVGGDGTALICAVREGHYDIAKILLENGADPFQNSPGDEYAMYHARIAGNKAMINLLKQYEDRR